MAMVVILLLESACAGRRSYRERSALLVAVRFDVGLCGKLGMLVGVMGMACREMRMMRGSLVVAGFMMRSGLRMVVRSLGEMVGSLLVVFCSLVRHGWDPSERVEFDLPLSGARRS
jgi:hypothetical protein